MRKRLTKEEFDSLPLYVRLINKHGISGTRMRLTAQDEFAEYYRDGGAWDVEVVVKDDKLTTDHRFEHLRDMTFIECTYKEWKKDNGKYVTSEKAYKIWNTTEHRDAIREANGYGNPDPDEDMDIPY